LEEIFLQDENDDGFVVVVAAAKVENGSVVPR
jgi:hypothetical protein